MTYDAKIVLNHDELLAFDAQRRRLQGHDGPISYTVEPKIAGVAVELVYTQGALSMASVRETGAGRKDLTPNIKTILSVPLTLTHRRNDLPPPDLLAVRGDVYMETQAFEQLNLHRVEGGLSPFSHLKAAAEDAIEQSNPRITAKQPIEMFCHEIGPAEGLPLTTHYQVMVQIQKWGLRINRRHLRVCEAIQDVLTYCDHLERTQGQFFYAVDGAIIKPNLLNGQNQRLREVNTPEASVVYRFTGAIPEKAVTGESRCE